jgi:hypothetical protein
MPSSGKEVFISYAGEDRAIAQRLAAALEQEGISVWWDRQIPVGSEWDKTIEEALATAKCSVVLWTKHAKESRWVRAEARESLKNHKLVPVMLEPDAIPLAFTGIQAFRFLQWDGARDTKDFAMLLLGVRAKLEGKSFDLPEIASTKASWLGKAVALIGVKAAVAGVVLLLLMASSLWRIAPDLEIRVQTSRITFTVTADDQDTRLTDELSFGELTFQHVGTVSFSPDRLLVANPADLDMVSDTYPPKAWVELAEDGRTLTFKSAKPGFDSGITVESTETKEHLGNQLPVAGQLDAIILTQDAAVTLEVTKQNAIHVAIRADQGRQRTVLSELNAVTLIEKGLVMPKDMSIPFSQDQELTYQAFFESKPGTMEIVGQDGNFILIIKEVGTQTKALFSKTALSIQSVDISWQDPATGERKSPEGMQGTITFNNPKGLLGVEFHAPMFITIDDLDHFEITSISLDPTLHTLVVDMQGQAGYIKTGTASNPRDHRPTLYDKIWFSPLFKPIRDLMG